MSSVAAASGQRLEAGSLPYPILLRVGKDGDNAAGPFSAASNCAYLYASPKACADERWIMNFKGISAPLNAGRLERMLGLPPSRRDPETQDASDKPSGNEPVRRLETENLYRSPAYK
ncbi:hypothetical protein [Rhizobium leguminosarum]|jgi:hypothetical protein|uniref:Uncharacterized protein n=2 Tax=Rhizobium leguminosarum TaxID=384 RepID=A0A4Q8XTP3_RHILE|nr:hypothetical protein [Rhizobium leguminosarum]TAU79852.1 hypothetical protein ELI41_31100 [Rhizobium leguminosarum]TAV43721.1 hypothetical protein ELI29_31450 [Rhizobium leguminosarum]TAV82855.1 hypothetical protein ELI21_30275 [Rhizobium leguminosarum]TAV83329.1 hypothetical protein ELI22_28885 [Rhizobium leguminosarum]TAW14267.1 hypothetical protein ELI19_31650 [Rhizobium leguminosarum]